MTDYPVAPSEESGAIKKFRERVDERVPVVGVANADAPTVNVSLTNSELKQAIESVRLQGDLLAVLKGGTTEHIIVGDIKKIGVWSLITFIIKLLSGKFF